MPGVTMNVVNFCPAAPSAHMGKVMRHALCRRRRSMTSGKTHRDARAASKKSGDLGCPRSA
eukprot:5093997-Pleurochrysis_carterae.AAC.1